MNRIIKYLIFTVALPAAGFLTMYVVRPATSGAHDGGFLGMMFGLIVAQIIFSIWLLELKWYFSSFVGLIIGIASVSFSFWLLWELREVYYPGGNPYAIRHDDELERKIEILFFVIIVPVSLFLFEITHRFTRKRRKNFLQEQS